MALNKFEYSTSFLLTFERRINVTNARVKTLKSNVLARTLDLKKWCIPTIIRYDFLKEGSNGYEVNKKKSVSYYAESLNSKSSSANEFLKNLS